MKIRTMQSFISSNEDPDILFWVGCAGSYDERYKKVTKAFVNILNKLKVDFAILGHEEGCTGDPQEDLVMNIFFKCKQLIIYLHLINII